MSAVKGDVFEVTIEGQYYTADKQNKSIKDYKVVVLMDEQAKQHGFLGVARGHILPRALKQQYPDYKRFRTHTITHVKNISNPNKPIRDLSLMNRDQIISYIKQKQLPIKFNLYPEVADLRQAIRDLHDGKEMFVKQQKKREEKHGPLLAMRNALDELNPTLANPHAIPASVEDTNPNPGGHGGAPQYKQFRSTAAQQVANQSPRESVYNLHEPSNNPYANLNPDEDGVNADFMDDDDARVDEYGNPLPDDYVEGSVGDITIPEFDNEKDLADLLKGI